MDKHYDFKKSEEKWKKYWDDNGIYASPKDFTYSIDTPPPTVSGNMHIGHAFSYAQEDFIARYKRMKGEKVFYPFGTDDNGLPTEKLVEKLKKIRSNRMDQGEFRKLCLDTVNEIKPDFVKPWIDLAISCDFKNSYSTIDPHCQKTAQLSFIELYKKGRIYQEESPMSWCTACRTAIAQAEFENVDMTSHFNDVIFKCSGKDLVVGTTRPELIPACVALFFNPDDERYTNLMNKFAKVPLFDYEVPILSDPNVDLEKGTGLMMVCTFGDKEDIEKWRKYNLLLRVAINHDGKLNNYAGKYSGERILDARKKILEDLKEKGFLINQKEITHAVNLHERCGTEIEFLQTKQWFVKILDKKQDLLDHADKIMWYPEHMKVRYVHWVENLNWDWCISRQRHYGVPIPVWYKDGEMVLPKESELPIDPTSDVPEGYKKDDLDPETDVFDTWMTSSLTPQIVLDKANDKEFKKNFPMSMRPQGHDIIRTWAFYTIVKGVFEDGNIPWKEIVISGHALDPKGRKMSKSKGNVVDPLKVMDQYGTDALRFWAAGSKLGEDLPYMEKDLVTGKKMVTKLWNASKFCLIHLEKFDVKSAPELLMMDRWILSKLYQMIKSCTNTFEKHEYSKTKVNTELFFWEHFCDNYLEIVKDRLYNPDVRGEDETNAARFCLYHVLLDVLKLVAPIMPYISEEIYQAYFAAKEGKKSIHESDWPDWNESLFDKEAENIGDIAVQILSAVRKYKSEKNVSLKVPVKLVKVKMKVENIKGIMLAMDDLKAATKAEEIELIGGSEEVGIKIIT